MARPGRLELPTLCLEGRCSIQLSYGRTTLILGYLCLARTLFCVTDPLLHRQTLIHDAVAKLSVEIVNLSATAYLSSPKHLPPEHVRGVFRASHA